MDLWMDGGSVQWVSTCTKTETARKQALGSLYTLSDSFPIQQRSLSNRASVRSCKIMIKSLNNATNGCFMSAGDVTRDNAELKWICAPCFLREDNDLFQVRVAPCRDRVAETTSQKLKSVFNMLFVSWSFRRYRRKMQQTSHRKLRRRARLAQWTSKSSSTVLTAVQFMLATSEIPTAWRSAMEAISWRWASTCLRSRAHPRPAVFSSVTWVPM